MSVVSTSVGKLDNPYFPEMTTEPRLMQTYVAVPDIQQDPQSLDAQTTS